MDSPNYFVDVDGGYLDASLPDVRKVAIDYLMEHRDVRFVEIYTSSSRKIRIGTVELSEVHPILRWQSSRGCSAILDRSGKIVKYN